MDVSAVTWWKLDLPIAFIIESEVTERDLLTMFLATFQDSSNWKPVFENGNSDPNRIVVKFTSPQGKDFLLSLDWWYETITWEGKISQKTAWKMYAGNMSVAKTTADLVEAAGIVAARLATDTRIESLLDISYPLTGRFGFDYRSSRDGIDRGYIANDLKTKETDTFAFAELLAVLGAQSFFPARCRADQTLISTRGWKIPGNADTEEYGVTSFVYSPWATPLPVILARVAAIGQLGGHYSAFRSIRKKRGELSNLSPSTSAAQLAIPTHE